MVHAQDLRHAILHAVGHKVVLMHHQLARAGHATGSADGGELGENFGFILDFTDERVRAVGVVPRDIGGDCLQVCQRRAGPAELHAQ